MESPGKMILDEHLRLINDLTSMVTPFIEGRGGDATKVSRFLKSNLLPHAHAENELLYPAIEPLMKTYGNVGDCMVMDHEYIEELTGKIESLIMRIEAEQGYSKMNLQMELHHLMLQLLTVVKLHMAKENRIYLPLFENYLSDEQQKKILGKIIEGNS